jgi:hypothetical protein
MLNVGRRSKLDENNYSSSRAGAWSSKEHKSGRNIEVDLMQIENGKVTGSRI